MAGSSPLAWGAWQAPFQFLFDMRFIPTRVGSIRPGPAQHEGKYGSSPLAWGACLLKSDKGKLGRFIPTRVGSIRRRGAPRNRPPVHPHSRGEHAAAFIIGRLAAGSSPLAWGACYLHQGDGSHCRFIPTRVGSIGPGIVGVAQNTVHPHSRGEHPQHPIQQRDRVRFIPTRVGSILRLRDCSSPCSVHPHSRGEHAIPLIAGCAAAGSSPLAWGA